MRTLYEDLRYGLRVLRASPGFTAVAVLTLALGIAVNTTVFSWVNSVWLNPLPGVSNAGELVAFESTAPNIEYQSTSFRDFRDFRDNLRQVSGLAATFLTPLRVGEGERAQRVWGELVSGNFFDVLGVEPQLGRFFAPEDQGDKSGSAPVVVLSHRLWHSQFQSNPAILGRQLLVNGRSLTVIGVTRPEFNGSMACLAYELWVPVTMAPQLNVHTEQMLTDRPVRNMKIMARLKPGVPVERAHAEAAAFAQNLARANPKTNRGIGALVVPFSASKGGAERVMLAPLKILMAMCVVVLLIVCVNVANLLLARSMARRKEFSVRLAMGASRIRLARQMLTESLLLASLGAVVGIPMAMWMGQSLVFLFPPTTAPVRIDDVQIRGNVLVFTILICAVAAVIAGLAPALHAMRPDVNSGLKDSGRGNSVGMRTRQLRGLLVVSEVALAVVALVGAGLFYESFASARAINPGFDARGVMVSRFDLDPTGYKDAEKVQFCRRLRERLEQSPVMESVTYADMIPLGLENAGPWHTLDVEGYQPAKGESMAMDRSMVAPGYFHLMRIPLLDGRDFTVLDDAKAPRVMIVNESFVRRYFAGGYAIGRKVKGPGGTLTVVGVAKDSKYFRLTERNKPYFYLPFDQQYYAGYHISFYLRSTRGPEEIAATLRREAAALNPNAGMFQTMTLTEYNGGAVFPQRLAASLLTVLGALSLLLAAVGLYSVMAYSVSQRTQEIGIRMAMGARPGDVLGMVVRTGMVLTGAGLVAGLLASLAATRLVAGMLMNVSATDPLIFAGSALFLTLAALLACLLPALRATHVDPIDALRSE
ncbi:MAG: ABC transporter permease [Bryobacterales bacterium]|nr:ABC transporter permease [Bryobacterales bacterium]